MTSEGETSGNEALQAEISDNAKWIIGGIIGVTFLLSFFALGFFGNMPMDFVWVGFVLPFVLAIFYLTGWQVEYEGTDNEYHLMAWGMAALSVAFITIVLLVGIDNIFGR